MPLLLTESDVAGLLSLPEAIDALEAAFRAQAKGTDGTANHPRARFFLPNGVLHHMAAAYPSRGVMGTKTYASFAGGTRFYVQLFSTETGELLAFIEADKLGQMRTGAATGLAARYLSHKDAETLALLGSGWQAETQAKAVLAARPHLKTVRVFSRDSARREAFCAKVGEQYVGVEFIPVQSAEAAVDNAEIVVCATTAREPILKGEWLRSDAFVAAVGANRMTAREVDVETVARAEMVVVDDLAQAKTEAAELIYAYESRKFSWEQARTIAEVVADCVPASDGIVLFKSLGIALEDIAVAAVVYENALARGLGREL